MDSFFFFVRYIMCECVCWELKRWCKSARKTLCRCWILKADPRALLNISKEKKRKKKKHDVKSPCIELCNPHFSGSEYEEAYQTFIILEFEVCMCVCEYLWSVFKTPNKVFTNHFSSHRKLFLVVKHIHTGICCYPSLNNI